MSSIQWFPHVHMEGDTQVIHLGWLGLASIVALTLWGAYKLYRDIKPKKWYGGMEKSWKQERKFVKSKFRSIR